MVTLRELFRYVEPEALSAPLILCKALDAEQPILAEQPSITMLSLKHNCH
jgi:hypothetical protein